MRNHEKQIEGMLIHVRDCQIWAEIYYLDSPTDYREYLPQSPLTVSQHALAMLDSSWDWPNPVSIRGMATPLSLLLVAGLFLYLVLHS